MLLYVLFGGMIATTWVQIIKAVPAARRRDAARGARAREVRHEPARAVRGGARQVRRRRARAGQARLEPARRDLARPRADVRHRRAAAHPDAVLHGARRAHRAPLGRSTRRRSSGSSIWSRSSSASARRCSSGATRSSAVDKGGNMAAPLLAEVLGGTGFLGFISAVAFATILAVVAGLTLSGAAALAHDLWGHVVRKRQGRGARAAARRARSRRSGSRSSRSRSASCSRARTSRSWSASRSRSRRARTSRRCSCR